MEVKNELRNVKTLEKPPRGRYEDKDVHKKSSDIKVYSLHEQTTEAIEANGLTNLWARVNRE